MCSSGPDVEEQRGAEEKVKQRWRRRREEEDDSSAFLYFTQKHTQTEGADKAGEKPRQTIASAEQPEIRRTRR